MSSCLLDPAIRFVEEFRKMDSEMQLQTVLIFLLVARKEGITVSDLQDLTGLTGSSCSRNVAALSDVNRKGREGHKLIMAKPDLEDRRVKHLYLTSKGRAVLNSVKESFNGNKTTG
jgi:DNA-binding MarR family transcriptional regulator